MFSFFLGDALAPGTRVRITCEFAGDKKDETAEIVDRLLPSRMSYFDIYRLRLTEKKDESCELITMTRNNFLVLDFDTSSQAEQKS